MRLRPLSAIKLAAGSIRETIALTCEVSSVLLAMLMRWPSPNCIRMVGWLSKGASQQPLVFGTEAGYMHVPCS